MAETPVSSLVSQCTTFTIYCSVLSVDRTTYIYLVKKRRPDFVFVLPKYVQEGEGPFLDLPSIPSIKIVFSTTAHSHEFVLVLVRKFLGTYTSHFLQESVCSICLWHQLKR